jgi:hypothetical protein
MFTLGTDTGDVPDEEARPSGGEVIGPAGADAPYVELSLP